MANNNNDRAPVIAKFQYEGADYSGKTLVFRILGLGDDGLIKKDLHYNFRMPQRCIGRGCKVCAYILKSGNKKLNKFKVNNRAVLLVQPAVLDSDGAVEWVSQEACVIELSPKVVKRVDDLVFADAVRFDGTSLLFGVVKTAEIGDRNVTFLDPDEIKIDDIGEWEDTFGPVPSVDQKLYNDTVKNHLEFPKAPTGKLLDMLIDELVSAEGGRGTAGPASGGPKPGGPAGGRPPGPPAPKVAPTVSKPSMASASGGKRDLSDAATAVKAAFKDVDL
jgi:hypothetical protein